MNQNTDILRLWEVAWLRPNGAPASRPALMRVDPSFSREIDTFALKRRIETLAMERFSEDQGVLQTLQDFIGSSVSLDFFQTAKYQTPETKILRTICPHSSQPRLSYVYTKEGLSLSDFQDKEIALQDIVLELAGTSKSMALWSVRRGGISFSAFRNYAMHPHLCE